MKNTCYVSSIENVNDWHRARYIIHRGEWHFAEFETGEQLDFFMNTTGVYMGIVTDRHYTSTEPDGTPCNLYQRSTLTISYIEELFFWTKDEIPKNAKPIKALSNGSIVTCYFIKRKDTLYFYRPNPNASRDIYNPLPLEQHINHVRIYGLY